MTRHANGEQHRTGRGQQAGNFEPAPRLNPGVQRDHRRMRPLGCEQIRQQGDLYERERHEMKDDQRADLGQGGGAGSHDDGERGQVVDRWQRDPQTGDSRDPQRTAAE
jgi:hypothetical protein